MHLWGTNVEQTLNSELADQLLPAGVLKGRDIPALQSRLYRIKIAIELFTLYCNWELCIESEDLYPNKSRSVFFVFDFNKDPRGFQQALLERCLKSAF